MARFYHFGMEQHDPTNRGILIGGGMKVGPDPDRPSEIPVPAHFGGGFIPLKQGGIAFGLVGHQFYHVGVGEYVDLPDSVSTKSIKNIAPQLLTKDEAIRQGLVNEDGSLKAAKPAPKDEPEQSNHADEPMAFVPVNAPADDDKPRRGRPPKQ